ncbi:MAG TPA: hypothetical protein VG106_15375, partial [Vicinamibacterales bacterium]|nr:hypothetical protein [Vicinamibacterales bacterium]
MEPWTNARFRSAPALELRRLEELPPEQQNAFRELQEDGDFYGLLVPRADLGVSIKAVGTQTAELFRRLAEPSHLDDALADECYQNDIIDLVLDGILEIEHGGAFVHGASAFPLFYPVLPAHDNGGRIAALSREAVRHAEDLATREVPALTSALYFYNRIPRTRAWTAQFPDRDSVLRHLGVHEFPLLDRYWVLAPEEHGRGWIAWSTREPRP